MTIGSFLSRNKIKEYIDKSSMLSKGDGVVLGLSGGPDSVCLFFVLLQLQQEYALTIRAVHVNHCIRGEDADADQAYVRQLCAQYGIKLEEIVLDIPAMAKLSGRSIEEEARLARYDAFEQQASLLANELGTDVKIAVAHNADDNVETVIFHMARGAGLDGMCGIAPVRGNVIRPLLRVPKNDILAILKENNIPYRVDATNQEVKYDRNRIRHNIMPELIKINDKALEHITEMTERLADIAEHILIEANGLLQIASEEGGQLRKRTILTAPRVLASQALKMYLSKFMPYQKDVAAVHIDTILDLLNEDGERQVQLPYNKTLIISYDNLYVLDEDEPEDKAVFDFRQFAFEEGMKYPTDNYTKWFDCDRITDNVVIRTRQEGDYLCIDSKGNHKSIQDYFVDEKIPKHLRDKIPLVCDQHHVMWVVGHRISEYYKISKNTTQVLEIVYRREENE